VAGWEVGLAVRARRENIKSDSGSVVEEWRIVKDHPDYEITRDGVMRKYSSKKVILNTAFGVTTFMYTRGGYRKSVSTLILRNTAFPELEAW
jgi:hypothetical protein